MADLVAFVHVRDEIGSSHVFGPGDKVPGWASKLITNPAAWAEGVQESAPVAVGEPESSIPAKAGPRATAAAWSAYALSQGFEIEGDPSRKEIIASLEAEGIPTE